MTYILAKIRDGYFDFCKKAIPLESYFKRNVYEEIVDHLLHDGSDCLCEGDIGDI